MHFPSVSTFCAVSNELPCSFIYSVLSVLADGYSAHPHMCMPTVCWSEYIVINLMTLSVVCLLGSTYTLHNTHGKTWGYNGIQDPIGELGFDEVGCVLVLHVFSKK